MLFLETSVCCFHLSKSWYFLADSIYANISGVDMFQPPFSLYRTIFSWVIVVLITARPWDTLFLVPEKNRAAQNRTSWGLYLCTEGIFFSKNSVTSRLQCISRLLLCSIVYSVRLLVQNGVSQVFWDPRKTVHLQGFGPKPCISSVLESN